MLYRAKKVVEINEYFSSVLSKRQVKVKNRHERSLGPGIQYIKLSTARSDDRQTTSTMDLYRL